MNKVTIVVVLAAAGLIGFLVFRKDGKVDSPKATTVAGYLDTAVQDDFQKRKDNPLLFLSEKEEERKKQFKDATFDEISLTKKGATVVMKKEGTDEWKLTEPLPSEVEAYRAKAMVELFATDTALDPAGTVKSAELLADYGLDDKRAIKITIKEKGITKVDLIIGNTKKLDKADDNGPDTYDTFVMLPGNTTTVYNARRKDLRQPFETELADLRSKKVFPFDLTQISKITIEGQAGADAAATKPAKITLAATWADKKKDDADKKPEAAPPVAEKKEDEKEGTFSLVEPAVAGFQLMEMRSFWSAVAGLRVNEFVMSKPGPETGLADAAKAGRVTVELADGKKHVVLFGNEKDKGKTFYAMLEGSSEHFLVSDFTRNNLLKSLDSLRDKNILGATTDEEITKVTLKNEHTPDGAMTFEREGAGWKMTPPPAAQLSLGATLSPDESEVKGLVSGLRYLRATDYETPPKLEDVGLVTPAITVTATVNGTDKTIAIGSVEKDGKVHARLEGTEIYFTLGNWTRDKLVKKPMDFKNKRLFSIAPADVTTLELVDGADTLRLERLADKPDAWKMTAPEAIDGASGLDDAVVNGIVTALKDFDVKGFTDKVKDGVGLVTPAFTVTVTLKDGTTRKILVSDTTEGEAHNIAVEAPGVEPAQVFTLDKFKVTNLRKKLADLKTK